MNSLDVPLAARGQRLMLPGVVSVSNLPPYRMGPYQLRIVASTQEMFSDKRRKVETDWNAGIVHIRCDLKESCALSLLTRHLITAIHYRSGLNDSSDEESYAHSCASGLVELALGQREFFSEFLTLMVALHESLWRTQAAKRRLCCEAQRSFRKICFVSSPSLWVVSSSKPCSLASLSMRSL
ncbi:MAG: hypothetical protein Q7J75_05825 [Rhodoferax sp.]|nr:hypothetical protein [Rhodoferax sp.]